MTDHAKPDPAAAAEIFYDGTCPVCRREIAMWRKLTPEGMDWRDVSGPDEAAPDLSREDALARFHARRADGRLVSGARAFLALWRRHPVLRPLARVLETPPLIHLAEGGYLLFLRVRRLWRRA